MSRLIAINYCNYCPNFHNNKLETAFCSELKKCLKPSEEHFFEYPIPEDCPLEISI